LAGNSVFGEREDGHYKNYKLLFTKQWHDITPKEPFSKIFAIRFVCCTGKWTEGQGEGVIA